MKYHIEGIIASAIIECESHSVELGKATEYINKVIEIIADNSESDKIALDDVKKAVKKNNEYFEIDNKNVINMKKGVTIAKLWIIFRANASTKELLAYINDEAKQILNK